MKSIMDYSSPFSPTTLIITTILLMNKINMIKNILHDYNASRSGQRLYKFISTE